MGLTDREELINAYFGFSEGMKEVADATRGNPEDIFRDEVSVDSIAGDLSYGVHDVLVVVSEGCTYSIGSCSGECMECFEDGLTDILAFDMMGREIEHSLQVLPMYDYQL